MADKTDSNPNGAGRPPISDDEKKLMLSKLEPYLKTGLSTRKSLLEAKIPSATFYRIYNADTQFREQIDAYRQFTSVLLNNALVSHLQALIRKQNGYQAKDPKTGKIIQVAGEKLSKEETDFLWKFATTSNLTKGEFGERKEVSVYDPEAEIQKVKGIIEEETTDEIEELPDVNDDE